MYILFQYGDRTWPVIILGAIMFIPGAYHVRLASYAYKGYDGYSYDDIPEFDEWQSNIYIYTCTRNILVAWEDLYIRQCHNLN